MYLPILRNNISLIIYNQMSVISLYRWDNCWIFFFNNGVYVSIRLLLFIFISLLDFKLKLIYSVVLLFFFIRVYGLLEATQREPDSIVKSDLPIPINFVSTERLIPLVVNCWMIDASEILRKAHQTGSSLDALSNVILVLIEVFVPNGSGSALHDADE